MAATLATDRVARGIGDGEAGVLMHGPTYMANPLACAAAIASIGLLLERDWRAEVAAIETALTEGLAPARGLPGVSDVRVLGAIGVIETASAVDLTAVQDVVMAHGVWLRPFRNLIYTMPPYVTEPDGPPADHHRDGRRRRHGLGGGPAIAAPVVLFRSANQ